MFYNIEEAMKHYLIGLVLLFIFGLGFLYIANNQPQKEQATAPQGYEYFWGDGCPHCANVETFLSGWDKAGTINLTKMEVWKNQTNASLLQKRAASCGIPDDKVGVPLLYTPDGQCISGDQPIISFLQNLGS